MNDHQLRICGQMANRLKRQLAINTSVTKLANDLIGMLDAGEFKDDAFCQEWMQYWGEIETAAATNSAGIRSEPIKKDVRRFRAFLESVLTREVVNKTKDALQTILAEEEASRSRHLSELHDWICADTLIEDEGLNDILSGICIDLDYYEPNESYQKEDPSFYGTERLEKEAKGFLQELEDFENRISESSSKKMKPQHYSDRSTA